MSRQPDHPGPPVGGDERASRAPAAGRGGDAGADAAATAPEKLADLEVGGWGAALRRTLKGARTDSLTDDAAALTYYAVLAIFPTLLVFVALVGLFGQYPRTTNAIFDIIERLGSRSAVDTVRGPITQVVRNKGGAGALLGVGILGALWSGSGYVGAFMRASNRIYEVAEGRRFWKLRPLQLAMTLVMVVLAALVAVAVVATGPLARSVGDQIGLGHTAVLAWDIAKWPVLLLVVVTMFAVLYYAAPNVKLPRFRWMSPGALLAIVAWLVASIGFGIYVANFGRYNQTYGSLGAIIVFLVWMWITNLVLLLGAKFDAELERSREVQAGVPGAQHALRLPPREVKERRRGA